MLFRHDQPAEAQSAPSGNGATPGGLVVERPPPGLARGTYPTSPLWICTLGAVLVLGTLLYYFFHSRKPRP